MSLDLKYSDPRGIDEPAALVSLGSNVRYGQFRVTLSAELGDPAMSTIDIEDPGGFYNLVGLRAFDSRETSAPSNNSMIGRFVMQDRVIGRDPDRALITGAARLWTVDLTDYNWHLSSRIHTDADAKRPVETAGDRIRWLLTNALHININDYGNVAYPTTEMDATDYRGQRARDLLADCAVEAGYNFWCDFNEAAGKPELFFLDPNGSSYQSDIAVSNVMDDVDNLTTFYPSMDAEVRRSVSRLTYGVYLAYANGSVYVRNPTVGEQFGTIDQTAPMSNVKTRARALRIANKFLADNDEEDDRITFEIIVPRAQVNDVRHGHLMSVRFQHIPGYETDTYVRVLKKSVIQDEALGDDYYRLALEAVPTGLSAPPAAVGFLGTRYGIWPSNEFWDASLIADGVTVVSSAELLAANGTLISFAAPIRARTWQILLVVNWDTVFMYPLHFNHAILVGTDGTDLFGNGWTPGGTDLSALGALSTQTFQGSGPADGFSMKGYVGGSPVSSYGGLSVDQTGVWGLNQTDIIGNYTRVLTYYWTWTL